MVGGPAYSRPCARSHLDARNGRRIDAVAARKRADELAREHALGGLAAGVGVEWDGDSQNEREPIVGVWEAEFVGLVVHRLQNLELGFAHRVLFARREFRHVGVSIQMKDDTAAVYAGRFGWWLSNEW